MGLLIPRYPQPLSDPWAQKPLHYHQPQLALSGLFLSGQLDQQTRHSLTRLLGLLALFLSALLGQKILRYQLRQ